MWENLLKLAMTNGLWATLFVFLFFYELKDSKLRENKYIGIIEELSENLKTVKSLDDKLSKISNNLKIKISNNKNTAINKTVKNEVKNEQI